MQSILPTPVIRPRSIGGIPASIFMSRTLRQPAGTTPA